MRTLTIGLILSAVALCTLTAYLGAEDNSEVYIDSEMQLISEGVPARYVPDPFTAGLWHFDEGTGTVAQDASVFMNHGNLVGGASWTTDGRCGSAVVVSSLGERVLVPDSPSLDITDYLTLEAWIKPAFDIEPGGVSGHWQGIIEKGNTYYLIMDYSDDGRLAFKIENNGLGVIRWLKSTKSYWEAGEWYHVAGTYDGQIAQVFVNGVLDASQDFGSNVPINLSSYGVAFGNDLNSPNAFIGVIDEVRISNTVRSPLACEQYYPAIAFDGTNYLVVWHDNRGSDSDIYGARVSKSGIVLDPCGIPICTAVGDQAYPEIGFDGSNYFVVWEDGRAGNRDIYGTRVSTSGDVLDPTGITISNATNEQRYPEITFGGTNYFVVWQDKRSGSWDIYGTRLSPAGAVIDAGGIDVSTASNDQYFPAIEYDGTNYLVVWQDQRSGAWDIYGARVSTSAAVLDPTGVPICAVAGNQSSPAVAFDGTNYFVVWHDYRGGTYSDIYGARVSTECSVLDPSSIRISNGTYREGYPAIEFDGTNYLVTWHDDRTAPEHHDVYGARVATSGSVLDTDGIPISIGDNTEWYPALAFDGMNYLVVWEDWRNVLPEIYGARVNQAGNVLEPDGIPISCGAEVVVAATLDFDPNTLNLKSSGRWVTCYIELTDGYDVADIDIASVMLNGTVPGEARPWDIGDYDMDGIADLMVKFDRSEVCAILTPGRNVAVTVTGNVGAERFSGTDYVDVINPPIIPPGEEEPMPSIEGVSLEVQPNPFNPSVQIEFGVPASARVVVQVLSITGQLIRTLEDSHRAAGRYAVMWDGRDGGGKDVASGLYICRLTVGSKVVTKKLTLLK